MSQQNKQEMVNSGIQEFIEVVLLREKVICDRTWTFALQRFFQYVAGKFPDHYPDYNEKIINDYIEHLQEKQKQPYTIGNFIKAIIAYSQFNRKDLKIEDIHKISVEKEEHPFIDEIEDLYEIEKFLYEQVRDLLSKINVNNEPTFTDLSHVPYAQLRNGLQNYLMFRLVIETSMNADEIASLNMDSLDNDGLLHILDRKIPLLTNTVRLFEEYIHFRKNFDHSIYHQQVLKEVFFGKIPFDSMEKMQEFLEKSQEEKLAEIKQILLEQISLEEEMYQLEAEGEEEKAQLLENKIDNLTEISGDMKKVIVYERKLGEYAFNEAMFVSNNYKRMEENDIIQMMERKSLPISKLQNTIINKWEAEKMDPSIVGKLIGSKNVSKKETADELIKFQKVLEAGFRFPDRQLLV